MRVDKGGDFIDQEFQGYCLQTGMPLEFASTNTPQAICMSERAERSLVAALVRCLLANSGLPKFLWGEVMFTEVFLGNRRNWHAVPIPFATRNGAGSATSSSPRCPDLRAHRVVL